MLFAQVMIVSECSYCTTPDNDIDLDRELAFIWQGAGGGAVVLPNISYEEQFAGYYDLDGSKVYVKTIHIGSLGTSKEKKIPHNIANIKSVIDIDSRFKIGSLFYSTGYNSGYYFSFKCDSQDIWAGTNCGNEEIDGFATLRYTCTDR